MDENQPHNINLPLGAVEPHEALLDMPSNDQLLYKVMRVEDLIKSISGSYLHFNRVDSYKDFHGADIHDGDQLPKDFSGNESSKFARAPEFSAADYYNQCRARTYACCFSLENSDHIWCNYGNGSEKGKVCLVFRFGKLRTMLNNTLENGNSAIEYNGIRCHQIFSVNYGLIRYIEWKMHKANAEHLPNPVEYIYFKDKKTFEKEKELRISLSAIGIGKFLLKDGSTIKFPANLQVAFEFGKAITDGVINEILYSPDCDLDYLHSELQRFGIKAR